MKKTLILILSLLFISTTYIYNSYGKQFWYTPFKIIAYNHPISDENKIFEGSTNDVICIDMDKQYVIVYNGSSENKFNMLWMESNGNQRVDIFTNDEQKNNVCVTVSKVEDNTNGYIITFSYPKSILVYFTVSLKH